MAIDIKFDLTGNPEPPTIVLANRNGNKLGQLKVNEESINLVDKFNDASEISFTVNKYIDDEIVPLWDKIVDFKLIYCKEWDIWFEIRVELDEETESVKTIFGTQLGYAELSQVMLYNIEINTEKDIERDDYKISILYDPEDSKASILDRMFEKAPHYSIIHVDPTIANIQRSFSFDGTSLVDACQEVAKEIGCLFVFHSDSYVELGEKEGMPRRVVSVYDLYQNCKNKDCKYRGEFTDKCPKCGSTDIDYGYGDDTLIFVTADELATNGIQLVTDTDAVKNCFKLEAGDDLMTATVRNCNPNGTDYLWYFSDSLKEDMSEELVKKLESYDESYKYYYKEHVVSLDADHVNKYNNLVKKYLEYNEDLQKIATPIKGYASLMNAYYNVVDLNGYLKHSLMPSIEMSKTDAKKQAALLTDSSLSPVAVGDASIASEATANSAVLGMARVVVKSTYKVQIKSSEYNKDTQTWNGIFTVTNYSDEEDTADSSSVSVKINDDLESFVKQKINKTLNDEDTDDLSITGLFKKEGTSFSNALKEYALVPLTTFRDACQSCLDIMIDQGVANPKKFEGLASEFNLYTKLYLPYYNKLLAIEAEMKVREEEIQIISGKYNLSEILVKEGLQQKIEKHRDAIQRELNFQNFVGDDLWMEFCAFRREDTYSNDNYISDGLDNAELFKKALEFYVAAENEIYKSAELQHSISSTLNNLLAIEKFKPLIDSFEVGNWLRVRIDEKIFKLRLLEYEIDFGDFDNISVEFSDVTKIKNGITDVESILSQASSMATSYGAVLKQAEKGNEARSTIREWLNDGLNSALVQIQNNTNEDIIIDKNGLLSRSYSEIVEEYSPEQFKLTHNIMAYTDDNWKTVRQAIGKHEYQKYDIGDKEFKTTVGYGMSADFVIAGTVSGSQIIGGDIYSANYGSNEGKGTHLNLTEGDFDFAGGRLTYDGDTLKLKNVTIEWENSTKPNMTVEDITDIGEYLDELENLKDQIDGRAQTWYQEEDPSEDWSTLEDKAIHVGDLWHYTGETYTENGDDDDEENDVIRTKNSEWVWQEVDGVYQWVEIEIPEEVFNKVFDIVDGKAQIFVNVLYPISPYYKGDLWVQGETGDILHCIQTEEEEGSYNQSDWVKSSKYTDDTKADEAYGLAAESKGIAENAKSIGDRLVNGLGFQQTEITGEYVISPVIAGGHLLIGDTNSTYAQITTEGLLKCQNADIHGNITATSLSLGNDIYIGKNEKDENFFGVSTNGLLTARNAWIQGTIYATNGEFTGTVYATDGEFEGVVRSTEGLIGGWTIGEDMLYKERTEKMDNNEYKTYTILSNKDDIDENIVFATCVKSLDDLSDAFFIINQGNLLNQGYMQLGFEDSNHIYFSPTGITLYDSSGSAGLMCGIAEIANTTTYTIDKRAYIELTDECDFEISGMISESGSSEAGVYNYMSAVFGIYRNSDSISGSKVQINRMQFDFCSYDFSDYGIQYAERDLIVSAGGLVVSANQGNNTLFLEGSSVYLCTPDIYFPNAIGATPISGTDYIYPVVNVKTGRIGYITG